MLPTMRGGMQVHAVPDNEKALDANGRRLPWGFEYADADTTRGRTATERGPFGRSARRRGFSRSKTATPARKEDVARLENHQAEDAIFNSYKASQRTRDALPTSKSTPLLTLDPNIGAKGAAQADSQEEKEAVEVILYGYGKGQEWAAVEFYERVSGGVILEDYDRVPPHTRYDHALSSSRARSQRSLSKAALAKRNRYHGGLHWIKITFDCPESADLACDRSPHILHGHMVYAEPYRGAGPPKDGPIAVESEDKPNSISSRTISRRDDTATESPEGSSRTASSATIGEPIRMRDFGGPRPARGLEKSISMPSMSGLPGALPTDSTSVAHPEQREARQRPLRISGAKRAVLMPADQALMPTQPKYNGWLAFLPLLGLLFGGGKADTGSSTIPRLENGQVDWNNAGVYWWLFAWLDGILGTDMCGLKSDE